ncbi:MAG: phosphonopyruvate decarboxylase [Candidatus Marinimicrobia bacterium]|nr:phosphonopyruvate decarboxylase [Candidatus Neomarinimicrobiota bacterium]
MMKVEKFIEMLQAKGFAPITGVPCSIFKELINYLQTDNAIKHYICSSEGEAMGLAGGFALANRIPVVYMQSDGLGNAINPLSSLQLLYKLPALLLISWRAEPGIKDAPQHKIMGETLQDILKVFKIPFYILEDSVQYLEDSLRKAKKYIDESSTPVAFIVKKGYFEKYNTPIKKVQEDAGYIRLDYLKILESFLKADDIVLGATGFSGRELYQKMEIKGKFYMMGSMGCLASIGLGLCESDPQRRVFALDGDGALLMKMGTLSTIGYYRPANFIHILFNNSQYESTGGQKTVSSVVDFTQVAKNCGYLSVLDINSPTEFGTMLEKIAQYAKPLFINIPIKSGTIAELGRPSDPPEAMRDAVQELF